MDFIKIRHVIPKDNLSDYLEGLNLQILSYGHFDYQQSFSQSNNILANYKIVVMDKGEAQLNIQRYHYTIKQGDCVLLPPFIYYSLTSKEPTSHYYIYFDTKEIQQTIMLASLFPKRCFVASQLLTQNHLTWLSQTHQFIENTTIGQYQLVLNLTLSLLTLMASDAKSNDSFNLSTYSKSVTETVERAITLVDQNINKPLQVRDIAANVGVSTSYLNSCFHQVFHIPTKQFITAFRFHEIILTLTQTETPISTIAYDFGYSSLYAFSNAFKKIHGISPSDYRNLYKTKRNNK